MRFAYADPPYPGLADYYEGHVDFDGEVDHAELVSRLQRFDAFALSTSARALPRVLSLCVERDLDVRVASWHRGARGNRPTRRPRNAWEPVIYYGGRATVEPRGLDTLECGVAPRLSDPRRVIGAKPAAFAFWLFELLGARPGDELHDLYPGSGGIARAWDVYERRAPQVSNASRVAGAEPSPAVAHASRRARANASRAADPQSVVQDLVETVERPSRETVDHAGEATVARRRGETVAHRSVASVEARGATLRAAAGAR